jgi:hypothetical protein
MFASLSLSDLADAGYPLHRAPPREERAIGRRLRALLKARCGAADPKFDEASS